MLKKRNLFRIAILLTLAIFAFQNCSPNGFSVIAVDSSASSAAEDKARNTTKVNQLSNANISAQPGSSITLTTNFDAVPMKEDYAVFIHFVDSNGNPASGLGGDYLPEIGTSQWRGPVSYNRTLNLPSSLPTGTYTIRMGLYRNVEPYTTRISLAMGPGVTVDNELRYTVGRLTVGSEGASQNQTPSPTPTNSDGSSPFGQDGSRYTLVFSDEFNNGFNTSVWNDTIWYEGRPDTQNYAVENGVLKIWPQRNSAGQFFNRTIDTDGKYYQTYGFFEIEAKLPVGKGTWPAFWLFNHIGSRRPEIDVMEAYAGGGPGSGWSDANFHPTAFAATVWPDIDRLAGTKTLQTGDLSTGFHKYALKWEPNRLTFYFDGQEFYTLNITYSDPMYLMLDLWYGSASGQPDDSTPQGKTNSYEINYIRAWQFK